MQRPVPSIDVREAGRRLAAGGSDNRPPLLVDVREILEFVEFRATPAVLLPLSELVARRDELPKDRPLLMICRSGGRSLQAAAFLLTAGWTDVTNVAGGTIAWLTAGLAISQGPPGPDAQAPSV